MNIHRLILISGLLCCLAGCAKEDQSQQQSPPSAPGPVELELGPAVLPEALVNHMHLHASQLQDLNDALRAGDLEAAATPAYWLSRHKTQESLPDGWATHLIKMRSAALAVEEATDLADAKAAAKNLAAACSDCHKANNRDIALPTVGSR